MEPLLNTLNILEEIENSDLSFNLGNGVRCSNHYIIDSVLNNPVVQISQLVNNNPIKLILNSGVVIEFLLHIESEITYTSKIIGNIPESETYTLKSNPFLVKESYFTSGNSKDLLDMVKAERCIVDHEVEYLPSKDYNCLRLFGSRKKPYSTSMTEYGALLPDVRRLVFMIVQQESKTPEFNRFILTNVTI